MVVIVVVFENVGVFVYFGVVVFIFDGFIFIIVGFIFIIEVCYQIFVCVVSGVVVVFQVFDIFFMLKQVFLFVVFFIESCFEGLNLILIVFLFLVLGVGIDVVIVIVGIVIWLESEVVVGVMYCGFIIGGNFGGIVFIIFMQEVGCEVFQNLVGVIYVSLISVGFLMGVIIDEIIVVGFMVMQVL